MSAFRIALFFLTAACAAIAPAGAQELSALPEEYTLCIPPGAWVDLDTGLMLPAETHRRHRADLRFDRDGRGFFVHPIHGGMAATLGAEEPDGDWSDERQRIHRGDKQPRTWFARTDRGSVARVTMAVVDPYSTASATLRWAVAPPSTPLFLKAPQRLRVFWSDKTIELRWRGAQREYLVEVDDGQEVRKRVVDGQQARIERAAGVMRYRIRVRGMAADGVVTLPVETVRYAPRAARRGTVDYPDNWYDVTGGLSLTRGAAAEEDAEVVFYLYGVYVPGGGVQKVGRGAEVYRRLHALPDEGYQPSYGRLDENDVLAVRLPDGRLGKVWLRPMKGRDLRSGMHVDFAFLPDGRPYFVPRPEAVTFDYGARGMELSWDPVDGATAYRVYRDGEKPIEVRKPRALLKGLERNRIHDLAVTTIGAHGEESDRCVVTAHTYGVKYRVGTFDLFAQRRGGYDLVGDEAVAEGADTLDVSITGSAGGAQSLTFAGPHGIAGAGGWEFGEFPKVAPPFATSWHSDGRFANVDRFLLVTRDGRWASVRIVSREYPKISLDYVLGPGR